MFWKKSIFDAESSYFCCYFRFVLDVFMKMHDDQFWLHFLIFKMRLKTRSASSICTFYCLVLHILIRLFGFINVKHIWSVLVFWRNKQNGDILSLSVILHSFLPIVVPVFLKQYPALVLHPLNFYILLLLMQLIGILLDRITKQEVSGKENKSDLHIIDKWESEKCEIHLYSALLDEHFVWPLFIRVS